MGQIVGLKAKPKRCNLNKLSQLGIHAAGEYILVSYDNSMTANGQGNFDRYIMGDGRTAATELELKYLDDSTHPYIVEEVNKAVADIQPIEITGDVTNAPDEEDLTSENQGGTDVLKFKDKAYNAALYSGLGRVYLRKNIVTLEGTGKNVLTQAMVNTANTIYHIQYDYDLNGQTITIPAGCVLEFDGGSLTNGVVVGNGTMLSGCSDNCLQVSFGGSFKDIEIDAAWVGLIPQGNGTFSGTPNQMNMFKRLESLINSMETAVVNFRKGFYGFGGGGTTKPPYVIVASWYNYHALSIIEGSSITKNLTINGNGAAFVNVFASYIGSWKLSGGNYVKDVNTSVTDPTNVTQGGGFIVVYTENAVDVNLYDFTEDYNISQLQFGGHQGATQGQIGIEVKTAGNINIKNVTAKNNVTDGFMISFKNEATPPNNVIISDCLTENNVRLGLTIEGGKNVLVENVTFRNLGQIYEIGVGTDYFYTFDRPWSAIDIEPMLGRRTIGDVYIKDCIFENINRFCVVSSHQNIESIVIENCVAVNNEIDGDVRNTTRGKHSPCLSYDMTTGEVYETNSTYNQGVEFTVFANIRAGKNNVSVNDINLTNIVLGGASTFEVPTAPPDDFDPSDTSVVYPFLRDIPVAANVQNVFMSLKRIWEDNTRAVSAFAFNSAEYNYVYAYSGGAWSWSMVNVYDEGTYENLYAYGNTRYKNICISADNFFVFSTHVGKKGWKVFDDIVYIVNDSLTRSVLPTAYIPSVVRDFTIIDNNRTGTTTTAKQNALPLSKAGAKIKYIPIAANHGFAFSNTIAAADADSLFVSDGQLLLQQLEASVMMLGTGGYNKLRFGVAYTNFINALDNYTTFLGITNFAYQAVVNVSTGKTLFALTQKGAWKRYAAPLKGFAGTSVADVTTLNSTLYNENSLLHKGEVVLDESRGLLIIGKNERNNDYYRYDGETYNIRESGTTAQRPTPTKVGFRYYDTDLGKNIWWDGSGWVDGTGAPAANSLKVVSISQSDYDNLGTKDPDTLYVIS